MPNKDELIKLMEKHQLTARETAELLGVSIETVYAWKYSKRNMPDPMLRLLKYELK